MLTTLLFILGAQSRRVRHAFITMLAVLFIGGLIVIVIALSSPRVEFVPMSPEVLCQTYGTVCP